MRLPVFLVTSLLGPDAGDLRVGQLRELDAELVERQGLALQRTHDLLLDDTQHLGRSRDVLVEDRIIFLNLSRVEVSSESTCRVCRLLEDL